ncbi:MAG TPA: UvrD-helicase domain-containing protein [Patescibacteria group bacterium]|nr:UvrD-helicase domain-containing protein [Patescibacteria group bacterium]
MALDFAKELNKEQLDVVLHGEGPCLVLAGAGSGKTRTITYRVAYLLEQGVKPENILLVTFTNKAAEEMKMRVERLMVNHGRGVLPYARTDGEGGYPRTFRISDRLDPAAAGQSAPTTKQRLPSALPWSGTFHHVAYRILRIYAPLFGYTNNFSVLDSDDSESLLKMCVKEVKASQDERRFPSASVIGAMISYARNAELPLDHVIETRFYQWIQVAEEIKMIGHAYTQRKKEANAMDFDDLLVNLLRLLSETTPLVPSLKAGGEPIATSPFKERLGEVSLANSPVLKKYATQFQYVLVDEYQDTNKIQASIIKQFSSVHKNILVVGDDAQSIYSFRAADIQNILGFGKQYPGAKIFKLETNYRSTQPILEVANSVIENNPHQYKKNLHVADRRGGVTPPLRDVRPALYPQIDQQSEAQFITKKIVEHIEKGTPREEIAVLFRAAHHSQMLEVELVQAGIEYEYRGGVRFFERAHIKDILSYLRVLNNLADTAAWLRVLMHEEGIGPAAAQKVIEAVRDLVRTNVGIDCNQYLPQVAEVGYQVLGGKAQVGWGNFVKIWNIVSNVGRGAVSAPITGVGDGDVGGVEGGETLPTGQAGPPLRRPAQLIQSLLQSPYREYLEGEFVDARDRLDDIKQLAVFAERYENLEEFLANTSLQESFRNIGNESLGRDAINRVSTDTGDKGKIVLSTIHQAKGLEWSVVFIINLSAGGFPNDRALREENGLEEERRLFYVAITRAKKHLFLTYPMARLRQDYGGQAGGTFGDFMSGPSMFLNEIEPGLLEDHSLLSTDHTVFNDPHADVRYVSEDEEYNSKLKKIQPTSASGLRRGKPGSFLADINDL